MNIVFIATESAPFAKVGGLADVIGSLPQALKRIGHDVIVVMPHHGLVDDQKYPLTEVDSFDYGWMGGSTDVTVSTHQWGGVQYCFVRGWPYFTGEENYVYNYDTGVDLGRYLFFSAAALGVIRRFSQEKGWRPDVIHVNDWHTSFVPYLLSTWYRNDPFIGGAATVLSIHNIKYQGWGAGWHLSQANIPAPDDHLLNAAGLTDNALAIGVMYSNILSTVSPNYAAEITTYEGAHGLDGLIHARMSHLMGILNGIDTERWNPAASKLIPASYTPQTPALKKQNKLALQDALGLPVSEEIPLVGAVTRLDDQKGPAIMFPALHHMLHHAEMQFVLLGTGDPHWEYEARVLAEKYPHKASCQITFSEKLAEQIYAASDMFLMPSLFEPCGLGQMIAMRYGSLPVVRSVGGLADTVSPAEGFVFRDYSREAVIYALSEALELYYNHPEYWLARQQAVMYRDFSWETSARKYSDLYRWSMELKRIYG